MLKPNPHPACSIFVAGASEHDAPGSTAAWAAVLLHAHGGPVHAHELAGSSVRGTIFRAEWEAVSHALAECQRKCVGAGQKRVTLFTTSLDIAGFFKGTVPLSRRNESLAQLQVAVTETVRCTTLGVGKPVKLHHREFRGRVRPQEDGRLFLIVRLVRRSSNRRAERIARVELAREIERFRPENIPEVIRNLSE